MSETILKCTALSDTGFFHLDPDPEMNSGSISHKFIKICSFSSKSTIGKNAYIFPGGSVAKEIRKLLLSEERSRKVDILNFCDDLALIRGKNTDPQPFDRI